MMTGSGVQPTVTWGIVAAQMGFKRASDDLKQAAVNPEAGIAGDAMGARPLRQAQGLDPRRHRPLQGVRHRPGLDLLDRPVDAERLRPVRSCRSAPYLFPNIGDEQKTYFEMGGLELYKQSDKGRYEATMDAVKWLSDNSFLWTTVGRGASPRKSILERADYKTAGQPWDSPRRLRRRHELRDRGRDPGAGRPRLHHLFAAAISSPRRWRPSGPARPSRKRRWPRSRRSGRRTSTRAESRWHVRVGNRRACPRGRAHGRRVYAVSTCAAAPTAEAGMAEAARIARVRTRDPRPRIDWAGYVFVAFFTVPFLLFNVGPVLFGIYVGFTEWSIIGAPTWVGLDNFATAFADEWFARRFRQRLPLRR